MNAASINTAEEQLKTSESAAFLTNGTSMRPLIRAHKDIVVISRVQKPLKEGDVPLYKKDGADKLILHRIIDIAPDGTYIIRGDNTYSKEYIPQCDIIGVMTALYRGGKYIDCKTSKLYKVYIKVNRFLYPVRYLWKVKFRPILVKIVKKIIK